MIASSRMRTFFTLLLILISAAALCWGLFPLGRETGNLLISPQEMQLPTPNSLVLDLVI